MAFHLVVERLPRNAQLLRHGRADLAESEHFRPVRTVREAEAARICRLSEAEAVRFINGEAIQTDGEKGWTLVSVEGYSLGWGKQAGGQLKNHYPKGLRRQTEPAVQRADAAMQRVEPAVQGAGRPQGEWTI